MDGTLFGCLIRRAAPTTSKGHEKSGLCLPETTTSTTARREKMKFGACLVGVMTSAMIGYSIARAQEDPSDPYSWERPSDPKGLVPVSLVCPPSKDRGVLEVISTNQIGESLRI